jgi:hypothetical protein
MDWLHRKGRLTPARDSRALSCTVLSDIELPDPPLPIPRGHVPRYLKSAQPGPRLPPPDSLFSVVFIGEKEVQRFDHPARIPPRPHVFWQRPPSTTEHAKLMRTSWPSSQLFSQHSIPYSLRIFGEKDQKIGCFTRTIEVEVPIDYRSGKVETEKRAIVVTPSNWRRPSTVAIARPSPRE